MEVEVPPPAPPEVSLPAPDPSVVDPTHEVPPMYPPIKCPTCHTEHHHCDKDIDKKVNYFVLKRIITTR
jgi:hypothetical protein